jgi:hypothetical protein
MVDWSEPKVDYSGEGSDRGQVVFRQALPNSAMHVAFSVT